jgi:NADPH:quinone reductase-like Zn-dependent oxidoreductase
MKAVLLKGYGGINQLELGECPTPQPGPGEVLIRIAASAVNPFDLILRQGFMAQLIPLPLPCVLGGDAAGTVVQLGEGVTGVAVGDRVAADFIANGRGSHAEFGVVPANAVARLPDSMSFEQGASLVKAGLTGRQTVDALGVRAGDRVLVSGGLGAVGRVAIQHLQQIGAKPVAGVRPERLAEARALAGEAIDITANPATPAFDYAISAAAPVARLVPGHVRDGGLVVSIVQTPEDANPLGRVRVSEIRHRTDAALLDTVLKDAARGALDLPIARVFSLAQLAEAHEAMEADVHGKLVLRH